VGSLVDVAAKRAEFRATSRGHADRLLLLLLSELDKVQQEHHAPIVSMLITEMQIAIKKAEGQS
jgi:hypothetical protein